MRDISEIESSEVTILFHVDADGLLGKWITDVWNNEEFE